MSPTYKSWCDMHQRCKKHPEYAGRGITVDPAWSDFVVFLRDMGEQPEGLTLDRRENDGPYTKSNCRWATYAEQNANQRPRRPRTTRHGNATLTDDQVRAIRADGRAQRTIAAEYGLESHTIVGRIKRGQAHRHVV